MTTTTARRIHYTGDLTDRIFDLADEVADFYAAESRIPWDDFIDRLSDYGEHEVDDPFTFDDYYNPAIEKIKRHVRELRRDS